MLNPFKYSLLATLTLAAAAPITEGAFVPIDTFQGYTAGDAVAGTNGWSAGTGNGTDYTVIADPTDSENLILKRTATTAGGHGVLLNNLASNAIAPGTTGTLYFRFLTPADGTGGNNDFSAGLANSGAANLAGDVDKGYTGAVKAPDNTTSLIPFPIGSGSADLSPDTESTWYSVWVITNKAGNEGSDTFSAYIQGGSAYPSQTRFATDVVSNIQIAGALDTLKLGVWETRNNGFDDFYIDKTGENLTFAAVPEPSSALLLTGFATVSLAIRRRR